MKRKRIHTDFSDDFCKDYARISKLARKHDITRGEVVRRGMRFALKWSSLSFWQKVKICFFRL